MRVWTFAFSSLVGQLSKNMVCGRLLGDAGPMSGNHGTCR